MLHAPNKAQKMEHNLEGLYFRIQLLIVIGKLSY